MDNKHLLWQMWRKRIGILIWHHQIITVITTMVGLYPILIEVGPRIAAVFLKDNTKPPYQLQAVISDNHNGARPRGTIRVEIPSTMKISETAPAEVHLRSDEQPYDRMTPSSSQSEQNKDHGLIARLEGPDFKIIKGASVKSTIDDFPYQWAWLISPEKTGKRGLYLWIEPDVMLFLSGENNQVLLDKDHSRIFVPIEVLTERGLTPFQEGWATAIVGGFVLIGVIVGYPFIKRLFRQPDKESDE